MQTMESLSATYLIRFAGISLSTHHYFSELFLDKAIDGVFTFRLGVKKDLSLTCFETSKLVMLSLVLIRFARISVSTLHFFRSIP